MRIQLVVASLEEWKNRESAITSFVSDAEAQQAAQFVFAEDRLLALLARACVRRSLGAWMKRDPHQLQFSLNAFGKPLVASGPAFSLSHSRSNTAGAVAVVISSTGDAGVDIEPRDRGHELDMLALNHFSECERDILARLPEHERSERTVQMWTVKEAVAKATGRGIQYPLSQIETSPLDAGCSTLEGFAISRFAYRGFLGAIATTKEAPIEIVELSGDQLQLVEPQQFAWI